MKHLAWLFVACGLVMGCTNSTTTGDSDSGSPRPDTGNGGTDTGMPGTDTGVPGTDTGVGDVDTGVGDVDTGPSDVDANVMADAGSDSGPTTFPDGGLMCRAGAECTNWAAAVAAASTLNGAAGNTPAEALANCVIQTHQTDCCGARRAYGFNHAARTQLCTAETACRMQYPATPGCSSDTIVTDTGESTTMQNQVRLRVVNPMSCTFGTCYTCETFVCTDASCANAPGIMPAQCG